MKQLNLSKTLKLPTSAVTETFGILGARGSGKSNTGVVLAEEFYKAGIPWVAIDPKGDWFGIRASASSKGPGLSVPVFGGLHGDVPLEPRSGKMVAELIVAENLSAVIDVSDFESLGDRHRFLIDFGSALYNLHRRNPAPRHIFLEEAHEYIPQQATKDKAKLKEVMARIPLQGRTFGLGSTTMSQRSARLHKDVLTQIGTLIAMRTGGPQDKKAIQDWVEEHALGKDMIASLPSLKSGEAWVWSPVFLGIFEKHMIRRRETFDSGATPITAKQTRTVLSLADIDLEAIKEKMADTIERAQADDPKALKTELARLKREIASKEKEVIEVGPSEEEIQGRIEAAMEEARQRADEKIDELKDVIRQMHKIAEQHIEPLTMEDIVRRHTNQKKTRISGNKGGLYPNSRISSAEYKAAQAEQNRQARQSVERIAAAGNGSLSGPQQRILDALAWLESIGVDQPQNAAVAFLAGYKPSGGAYNNPRGKLRGKGYIEYVAGNPRLTDEGRKLARFPEDMPTREQLHEAVLGRLPGPERRLLRPLLEAYPEPLSNQQLAKAAGYEPSGGAFNNPRGRLRSLGLIEYQPPGHVVAREILFP